MSTLTKWERAQIGLWAASNALTYATHKANGVRMAPSEIEEMERWTALAEKMREPIGPELSFAQSLDGLFVIWSKEHSAWWRPNRCGYVIEVMGAGLYTKAEATSIVDDGKRERMEPAREAWARFANGISADSLLARFIASNSSVAA